MLEQWKQFATSCLLIWKIDGYSQLLIDECRTDFFPAVAYHIERAVMPKYKDNDKLTSMLPEDAVIACEDAIKKYIARYSKNQRPYNDGRDCVKRAHYAQLMMKYGNRGVFTPEDTFEVWSAFLDYRKLGKEERHAS